VKGAAKRVVSSLIVVAHLSACATSGKPPPAGYEAGCDRAGSGAGLVQDAKAGAAAGVEGFKTSLGVSSCSDLAGCGLIALLLPIFVAGGAIAGAMAGAVRTVADEPATAVGPSCRGGSVPDLTPPATR
jgi:hypothetical protein